MAYEVRYTDLANKGVITVEDNTINTETSLQLPGRFTNSYGQLISENLLHLLENFANNTAPERPVEGQLWYDTTDGVDQLKIYDGTGWISASGLKKSAQEPAASNSNEGDLWVDTDNQQLYLYTGSNWILVGPTFSDGLVTGATPVELVGQDNVTYVVLQIQIQDVVVGIISNNQFSPKSRIAGFDTIFKGFNLISGSDYQFVGIASTSAALRVTNDPNSGTLNVSANDFLRGDVPSTTTEQIRIKNNDGLQIGAGGQLNIGVEGEAGIIQHNTSGSNIDIRVRDGSQTKTVIRVDSTTNVGINNLAPDEALDVIGNIQIAPAAGDATTGVLKVESTVDSDTFANGSITTKGGVGITKNLNVGGSAQITDLLTTANVLPDSTSTRNIGNSLNRYDQVYANTFFGNVQGNVSGTVSGKAGSADRLASATSFAMSGDVSAPSFEFDGKTGSSTKTFVTTISNSFISTKNTLYDANPGDEILINKTSGTEQGLYKISRVNFLKTIPIIPAGVIVPYGGITPPTGWLLCDGSEVRKSDFGDLFIAIGYNFKDPSEISDNGVNFFALPDMRGRFPLGVDNMGGAAANRVTSAGATAIGNNLGSETTTIGLENLPEHEHDLRGNSGAQYYAIRDNSGVPADGTAIQYDAPTGTLAGQALPSSGGVRQSETITDEFGNVVPKLGTPMDIMNPYLAVNYIIYAG
jgi:microcystin-dependent protein